jgi:hypothetical protein
MYQPVLVGSGNVGLQFLKQTYDRQLEAFSSYAQVKRDVEFFRENIESITSAENLVSDRRLLNVALTAFGLESDIDNRFFIQKMLEEGTLADDSLANRFTDERYAELSAAFGFGPGEVPGRLREGFADEIIQMFEAASFEAAVGAQDDTLRIALFAERKLNEVLSSSTSVDSAWFAIMAQPPMRALFETALNLPSQFSQIDIDQQLEVFKERASRTFGSEDPAVFLEDSELDNLIVTYMARSQLQNSTLNQSRFSIALTLLQ